MLVVLVLNQSLLQQSKLLISENEIGYWQLASSCDGISEACLALGTPVTGGNVSLYNESKNQQNETTLFLL